MHKIYYNPNLKERARQLRRNPTPGERRLWKYLKGDALMGYDFHRQKPIDNFIVDFFCYQLKLVVELDGPYHTKEVQAEKDRARDARLEELGIQVIRFTEKEVFLDLNNVLRTLENFILDFEARQTSMG